MKPKTGPKEAVMSLRMTLPMKRDVKAEAKRYRVSQNSVIIGAIRKAIESRKAPRVSK
jgi:hypothetical protein